MALNTLLPRRSAAISAMLILLTIGSACRNDVPCETQDFIMGTIVTQRLYGPAAGKAAAAVTARLRELEALFSFHAPGSDISRINRAAGGPGMQCSPETVGLLEQSLDYARVSDGAFNVMVGPLVKRWKVTAPAPDVPLPAEIAALRRLISYSDCRINREQRTVSLARRGQMLDLGGIAKGYASDEALLLYRKFGIRSAIVDIGGNIGIIGTRPNGEPWKIGVQDPVKKRGNYIGFLSLTGKSLSTSGAYERYFVSGGKRYSHIIDPRTGYPAESGLASVTVVADSSVESDALSTALFVLGVSRGIALLKGRTGTDALFVTTDGKIVMTRGLKGAFTLTAPAGDYEVIDNERDGPGSRPSI